MNTKYIEKFFSLKAKASKQLEDEIKAELDVEDPDEEQAKAIIGTNDDNTKGT